MKRYALLDTDFISKTHSVQDDGGNHLIDRVMELPEYLLQIRNFYFLRISAALLGFYTGLQVNHKAQIGLDEQNNHRIICAPMRIVLLCGPCIFCKNV